MTEADLQLREVVDSDIATFFAQQNGLAGRHMAAFVRSESADPSKFREHWQRIRADPTVRIRTIEWDGRVAGSVLSYESEGQAEVSYWLGQEFWGRGLATAALARFLVEGDARRPMLARVAADNDASLHVLEKNGFVRIERSQGFAEARGAEIDEWTLRLDVE